MDPKFLIVICVTLLLTSFSDGMGCDTVVKENDELIIFCKLSGNENLVKWYVTDNAVKYKVVQCRKDKQNSLSLCRAGVVFPDTDFDYGIHLDGLTSRHYLKLSRVPREITQVKCVTRGVISYENTCNITVVVPAYDSFCVSSITDNYVFNFTCTFMVYPKARCRISPQTHKGIKGITTTYSFIQQSLNGRPVYIITCTIIGKVINTQLPINGTVEFIPSVTNGRTFSRLSHVILLAGLGASQQPNTTHHKVLYTVVPICLVLLVVTIGSIVIMVRLNRNSRNVDREPQGQQTADFVTPGYPRRNVMECSRNQESSNGITNTPRPSRILRDVGEPVSNLNWDFPPTYSLIVNINTNNDVTRPADIPAVSSRPPSYNTVMGQATRRQVREGTQFIQERNLSSDTINDLPPPYPGR